MNRCVMALLCILIASFAQAKTFTIYHDSDYSNHQESADSMFMGISTALDEINSQLKGHRFELVKLDHRGNSKRSYLHLKKFVSDPQALFVLGGLHSPPYIKYRSFINENEIPLMIPWAAGGPITRYPSGENWVFRVSIDDTKAGYRIVDFALRKKQCKKPHLLLEQTPWGESNHGTMTSALKESTGKVPSTTWFHWNTQENLARIMIRDILAEEADCILYVGNSLEAKHFALALSSLEQGKDIPFISHWGITGGKFHEMVNSTHRENIDLYFIQSCFSFLHEQQSELANKVFERSKNLFKGQVEKRSDIKSPPGFIHAYDLTKLILEALKEVDLDGSIESIRKDLRFQMENINKPVQGLVKEYRQPFSSWSKDNDDAHEALNLKDFCMAKYDSDGHIIVYSN